MTADDIAGIAITLAFLILMWLGALRLSRFLVSYRFSADGIDILAFGGRVRVLRIRKENIREVRVDRKWTLGRLNPTTVNIANRMFGPGLLVRTRRGRWFLTPDDNEAAIRALGMARNDD